MTQFGLITAGKPTEAENTASGLNSPTLQQLAFQIVVEEFSPSVCPVLASFSKHLGRREQQCYTTEPCLWHDLARLSSCASS